MKEWLEPHEALSYEIAGIVKMVPEFSPDVETASQNKAGPFSDKLLIVLRTDTLFRVMRIYRNRFCLFRPIARKFSGE